MSTSDLISEQLFRSVPKTFILQLLSLLEHLLVLVIVHSISWKFQAQIQLPPLYFLFWSAYAAFYRTETYFCDICIDWGQIFCRSRGQYVLFIWNGRLKFSVSHWSLRTPVNFLKKLDTIISWAVSNHLSLK